MCIWRPADFHVHSSIYAHTGLQEHRVPISIYVCWSVHSGVSFISGSSWFQSALPLTDSVVHSANWEPCICITQLVMN